MINFVKSCKLGYLPQKRQTSSKPGTSRDAQKSGETSSTVIQEAQKSRNILDELMTDKPEYARAIAAERLQNTEPSPLTKPAKIKKFFFQKKIRNEQCAEKLKKQVQNANLVLQHRAFLAGKKWHNIKDEVVARLKDEFTTDLSNTSFSPHFRDKRDTFGVKESSLVHRTIDNVMGGSELYHNEEYRSKGARFKAFKRGGEAERLLDATQVRTIDGDLYELINTPTQEQKNDIEQQSGASISPKGVLGRNSKVKVRFARHLNSGNYVAIKKFETCAGDIVDELKGYRLTSKIGSQKRLMQFYGAAILSEKGYLFMPIMNRGDGVAAAKRIARLRNVSSGQAQAKLLFTAKEYAGAVADLHAKGLYHYDIKPSNFLHHCQKSGHAAGETEEEIIKITDFEALSNNPLRFRGGTAAFLPPEVLDLSGFVSGENYSAEKHDAFSLGLTLLYLKHGRYVDNAYTDRLYLSDGKSIKLNSRSYSQGKGTGCWGIRDKELSLKRYPLNTLDNVIAHLLNSDVEKRITPTSAYKALDKLYYDMLSRQTA